MIAEILKNIKYAPSNPHSIYGGIRKPNLNHIYTTDPHHVFRNQYDMYHLNILNKQTRANLESSFNTTNCFKIIELYRNVLRTIFDRINQLFIEDRSFFKYLISIVDTAKYYASQENPTSRQTKFVEGYKMIIYKIFGYKSITNKIDVEGHIKPIIKLCDFLINNNEYYYDKLRKKASLGSKCAIRYFPQMEKSKKLAMSIKSKLSRLTISGRQLKRNPFDKKILYKTVNTAFRLFSSISAEIKKSSILFSNVNQKQLRSNSSSRLSL